MKRFVKVQLLLAFVLGLVLAGCDFVSDDEDEKSGGSGNSSGNEGSSQGVPVLVEGAWTDGTISKDGQTNRYSINVAARTRYFIHLNDIDDGDDTKTANVGIKISHSDGTVICSDYGVGSDCWEKPLTFLAPSTGTVTITAASYYNYRWERGIGTYAIKYTSRSEYDMLSKGVWKNDSIITDGQTNKYSINVVAGTQYSIYLNDRYEGDESKTADKIGLKIIYTQDSNSDNPVICNNYSNACKLYVKPYTFTAPNTGTITIIAASYYNYNWERGIGTYAIKYTSGS